MTSVEAIAYFQYVQQRPYPFWVGCFFARLPISGVVKWFQNI